MKYALSLTLLAWTLAPSVGCGGGTPSTVVPLTPVGFAYHWGANTGGPAELYTQARDSEWNGLNDGPGLGIYPDEDESDPTDPRFFWDYVVTPQGKWRAENYVCVPDDQTETQTWTWTGPSLEFDVTEGTTYHVGITHSVDACLSDALFFLQVFCPSQDPITYYSWLTDPVPSWTAPATETCTLEGRNNAIASGSPVCGDSDAHTIDCGAEDTFWIYR